jgi:hypothetical protein
LYTNQNELTLIDGKINVNAQDETHQEAEYQSTRQQLICPVDVNFTYANINQSDGAQGFPSAGIDLCPLSASL